MGLFSGKPVVRAAVVLISSSCGSCRGEEIFVDDPKDTDARPESSEPSPSSSTRPASIVPSPPRPRFTLHTDDRRLLAVATFVSCR